MKISVITATYNSGTTLRDTLESVLRQNYTDYELIVKDGGSTDILWISAVNMNRGLRDV